MRFRFALITDVHFGQPALYDGRLRKLSRMAPELASDFAAAMRDDFAPDLVVNLGDVVEDESAEADLLNYQRFLSALEPLPCPLLSVAGNHDSVNLSDEMLATLWGRAGPLYYSYKRGPLHFIVLRTVETPKKGVALPAEQVEFLRTELGQASCPVIVMMHHPAADSDLRGNRWFERAPHLCRVANRRELRAVIEQCPRVLAVFNGHAHWNHLDVIFGIPYVTLQSLIENVEEDAPGRAAAAWALVEFEDNRLSVRVVGAEPARYQFSLARSAVRGS